MSQAIYETRGRAREFNELALNHYKGCGHQCVYCYGADVTHQNPDDFKNKCLPRVTLDMIAKDASQLAKREEKRPILLSFVTDPYQPFDEIGYFTRQVITVLKQFNLRVTILTKGGLRSMRDFDLLTNQDEYATTLTCDNAEDSQKWEPNAALPIDRINALKAAFYRSIQTWVSFEPVIYPEQTLNLLQMTHPYVGHYKVGTMNYHEHGKTINWRKFLMDVEVHLRRLKKPYYIKKDLARYKSEVNGYWWQP